MLKLISVLIVALVLVSNVQAQTASDFTATDCDGITHNLFTELDNGKIIVLVWVEPCSGCVSDAKAAYDAVMSFGSTNPGKVKYWLIDDIGDTPCSALSSWAVSSNIIIDNIQMFSNLGDSINENNFGGMGMPHVVVVGNSSHHIYINLFNGSNNGPVITAAINQAITNNINNVVNPKFTIYPNPFKDFLNIACNAVDAGKVDIELFDIFGKSLKMITSENQIPGFNNIQINLNNDIPVGNYFLKCSSNSDSKVFLISKTNF